MKVPFYNPRNPEATYENNDYKWVDLEIFLKVLNDDIIKEFWELSAFHLDDIDKPQWKEKIQKYPPVSLWGDDFVEFWEFIIASKVLYTTGFMCEYGLWKKWTWNHHWIDLILPKNTPIESFTDWEVIRIKKWDGVKKNEWNCVVIKSNINWEELYFSYEHLEDIDVKLGDFVKKWDKIWTCGSTWNSTTNHLHFQIDNEQAPFHPYWWKNIQQTAKFCIDPWAFLRENYIKNDLDWLRTDEEWWNQENSEEITKPQNNKITDWNKEEQIDNQSQKSSQNSQTSTDDLISNLIANIDNWENNADYVSFFKNIWILKWDNGNLYLRNPLTRYQFALILYRLVKKWFLKIKSDNCKISFNDTKNIKEEEFQNALKLVVCSWIMKGENNYFYPWKKLSWEQFLAVMWRLFADLKDNKNWIWYQNYLDWAVKNNIIDTNWKYIWKDISRNEVLKILYKLLFLDEIV